MPGLRIGPFPPLSEDLRTRSLRETLAAAPDRESIWLFTYGSLMWNPEFEPAESDFGMLAGYRRALNVWTAHARGTPENPGLALGLAVGGTCRGVLYRLDPSRENDDLPAIWNREMYTGVYRPEWLPVLGDRGETVEAIAFVTDPDHPQHAAPTEPDSAAALVARATGKYGSCRDYLARTLESLRRSGIEEPSLEKILRRADRLLARQ